MRLVEKPLKFPPYKCVVTHRHDGELVDFEADFVGVDPHIYLRRTVVEKAAVDLLEMVPKAEVEALRKQLEDLTAEYEDLREYVSKVETASNILEEIAA